MWLSSSARQPCATPGGIIRHAGWPSPIRNSMSWPLVDEPSRVSYRATFSAPITYHQSVWRWWMCHAFAVPGYIKEWLHWPKWSKKSSVSRMTSRKKPRSSPWVTSSLTTTPSIAFMVAMSGASVGAVLAHVVLDRVVRGDRLSGVAPEALQDVVLHQPMLDVPVVDVGDLELSAGGRLELGDDFPDRPVIEVDAGDGEVARGLGRLLDDPLDALGAIHLGDAEMIEVLAVLFTPEHHPRSLGLLPEGVDAGTDRGAEDVVAEQDDRPVAADEVLGQAQRLGDSAGPVLVRVEQAVDAELLAVAEQAQELSRVCPAGDQHHLGHAALDQRLDRVADHRAVVEREQVLVGDAGERVQPAARAAGEDDALHARILVGGFGWVRLLFDGHELAAARRAQHQVLRGRLLVVGRRIVEARGFARPAVAVERPDVGPGAGPGPAGRAPGAGWRRHGGADHGRDLHRGARPRLDPGHGDPADHGQPDRQRLLERRRRPGILAPPREQAPPRRRPQSLVAHSRRIRS